MKSQGLFLHLGLFAVTCVTTFGVFFGLYGGGVLGSTEDKLWGSFFYAAVVMSILLAHELGHYVMARVHRVDATLPYFIPLPLGFGTMGAVIRLKGRIPTRDALVDIGAGGPLAGLVIAVPMLFVGTWLSHVETVPDLAPSSFPPSLSLLNLASMFGLWVKSLLWDTPVPALPAVEIFGDNLLSWLAVRLIHGPLQPGQEVMAHPVFIASWFGLVMTMLNLLPVGQLDGGHLTHAWFGVGAERIGRGVASFALVLALLFSASWLVWFFVVTRFVGVKHPPVSTPQVPLSRRGKVIVVVTWVMTVLTFMPMPISLG
jgi:membrane-associated protease RseP (regulator of RpoE activity)